MGTCGSGYFKKFDPNKRGEFRPVKAYHDPERVPMLLLLLALMIGLSVFLVWALK